MTTRTVATGVGIALLGAICISPVVNAEATAQATDDIIAVGPVEVIEAGQITVLGQIYKTEDTAGVTAGEKVAVHGELQRRFGPDLSDWRRHESQ
jgi:hypothetical protein